MSAFPLLIWDVDDVLNQLMGAWLKYWNHENNSNFVLKDIKENPPNKILGISREIYFNSLDEFRNTEAGKSVQEDSTVKNWFNNHGNKYNHMACTARPIETMPNQSWWIYQNYGQWIHTIHAAGTYRELETDYRTVSKADFISWIDQKVIFIDDSEENINAVSATGSDTILYPQPWNGANYSAKNFITILNSKLGI